MIASIRKDKNTYHLNQMKFGSVMLPDDLFIFQYSMLFYLIIKIFNC